MRLPKQIKIVEVSPRDGLQNESRFISSSIKLTFIHLLSETGIKTIESTSFVSPKWVPQLSDHSYVLMHLEKKPDISYPVLVPNKIGFINALKAGANEIAVFTAASELFNQKNTHCSLNESLERCAEIILLAKKNNIRVRGYISCVLGCPYAKGACGNVATEDVLYMLNGLGIYTDVDMKKLLKAGRYISQFLKHPPRSKIGRINLN